MLIAFGLDRSRAQRLQKRLPCQPCPHLGPRPTRRTSPSGCAARVATAEASAAPTVPPSRTPIDAARFPVRPRAVRRQQRRPPPPCPQQGPRRRRASPSGRNWIRHTPSVPRRQQGAGTLRPSVRPQHDRRSCRERRLQGSSRKPPCLQRDPGDLRQSPRPAASAAAPSRTRNDSRGVHRAPAVPPSRTPADKRGAPPCPAASRPSRKLAATAEASAAAPPAVPPTRTPADERGCAPPCPAANAARPKQTSNATANEAFATNDGARPLAEPARRTACNACLQRNKRAIEPPQPSWRASNGTARTAAA